MKIIEDTGIGQINAFSSLAGQRLLEVGYEDGSRSRELVNMQTKLTGIDPCPTALRRAQARGLGATFLLGRAEDMPFPDKFFDSVFFPRSLHHIETSAMDKALEEAARVCHPAGHVFVEEPRFSGSYYDAQASFGIDGGDERNVKLVARNVLVNTRHLSMIKKLRSKTVFGLHSERDFVTSLHPNRRMSEVRSFFGSLPRSSSTCDYLLEAPRTVYVCKPNTI